MPDPRCNTVLGLIGEHAAMGLHDDYHDVRRRVDDLKAQQGEKDNPFGAPLIGVTFVIRKDDGSTYVCDASINALNINYLYAAPPDE